MTIDLVFPARDLVGESIVWDDRKNLLYWVDIIGKSIHSLNPKSGQHRVWTTPEIVTSIGLGVHEQVVVGLKKQVCLWGFEDNFIPLAKIEYDQPDNRLNEGIVAPDGSFLVGTMENNINPDGTARDIKKKSGQIYRVTADGVVDSLCDDRFGITNTFIWPGNNRLITADTRQNAIYGYEIDPTTGRLVNRTTLIKDFARGYPDGSTRDAEGFIWNCRVAGGGCLIRFDPAGNIDRIIDLPCSWPTSCTFGGPDLETLYVTSARFALHDTHLKNHPHEGGLFALDVKVKGIKANRFG